MLVAQGSAETMIEYGVKPWDMAAPYVIVTEAGGTFRDAWGGTRFDTNTLVCTNHALIDTVLAEPIAGQCETAIDVAVGVLRSVDLQRDVQAGDTGLGGFVAAAADARRGLAPRSDLNGVRRRLLEAARLGYTRAVVPPDPGPVPEDIRALVVPDLESAMQVLR